MEIYLHQLHERSKNERLEVANCWRVFFLLLDKHTHTDTQKRTQIESSRKKKRGKKIIKYFKY